MKLQSLTKALGASIVAVCAIAQLSADVVETKSGSRITGKVVKIDGSSVIVSTDFAGEIKVKQSEVTSIATDEPLNVRLDGGTVIPNVRAVRRLIAMPNWVGYSTGIRLAFSPRTTRAAILVQFE